MTSKSKKTSHTGMKLAFLGGLVATAAGAYYIATNKNSKKQIQKVKGWALKAKGEILEKLEAFKEVDEEMYHKVVATVMKKYKNVKNIDTSELTMVAKELGGHWDKIKKELTVAGKKTAKSAVSVAKKAKKAVTK